MDIIEKKIKIIKKKINNKKLPEKEYIELCKEIDSLTKELINITKKIHDESIIIYFKKDTEALEKLTRRNDINFYTELNSIIENTEEHYDGLLLENSLNVLDEDLCNQSNNNSQL